MFLGLHLLLKVVDTLEEDMTPQEQTNLLHVVMDCKLKLLVVLLLFFVPLSLFDCVWGLEQIDLDESTSEICSTITPFGTFKS